MKGPNLYNSLGSGPRQHYQESDEAELVEHNQPFQKYIKMASVYVWLTRLTS